MILLILLSLVVVVLLLIHTHSRYHERYWTRRGVVFYGKYKMVGPIWEFLFQKRSMFQLFNDIYKEHPDAPAVGIGSIITPALFVKDPENVNHVLYTDFRSFTDRGIPTNEDYILSHNILQLDGPKWKLLRQNVSPLFTTTKLRNMYYILDKSAQDFVDYLKSNPETLKGNGFETLNTFCCAAISGAVFGIGTTSTFGSPFIQVVRKALKPTSWSNLRFSITTTNSSVFKTLGLNFFPCDEKFFIGAIKKIIRQREQEGTKKHDFADLCVSLQKKGVMRDVDTGYEVVPTDEILAAQAFFFYIAGLEPCATAIFSTLVELGRHPDMLRKIHDEIDETFAKHNELTYDAVTDMEYLDKVLHEAMRVYPPIGFLTRECVKDTVLPVGNIKVDKGTKIFTPIYDLHNDSKYFENPDVFDPERFSRDLKNNGVYIPFGKGSRICIGMRYAKLQVKTGIVHVLRHFTVNTVMHKGGIKFSKEQVQVRLKNVDIEFVPRN